MKSIPEQGWLCPKCKHSVASNQNYCSVCGEGLDWSKVFISTPKTYILSIPYTPPDPSQITTVPFRDVDKIIVTC